MKDSGVFQKQLTNVCSHIALKPAACSISICCIDFLLADLGCGEYTRNYFSERRYEYLYCRSLGHNVPIIDGREQLAGEEHGCDGFETDGQGKTTISFAGAYANPELKYKTPDIINRRKNRGCRTKPSGTALFLRVRQQLLYLRLPPNR